MSMCSEVQSTISSFEDKAYSFADLARGQLYDPVPFWGDGQGRGQITISDRPEYQDDFGGYAWALAALPPVRDPETLIGTLCDFECEAPVVPVLGDLPGRESFDYTSDDYSREIVDRVIIAIENVLGGANLIPDWTWNSMRSRAAGNLQRTYQGEDREARAEHAARGHDLPGIVMLSRLREAKQKRRAASNELALQISTQQATQKREDYVFAIQQGLESEKILAGIHKEDQDRLLKTAVEKVQQWIATQGAVLTKFQTEAQVFGTIWAAIKTKIDALNAEFASELQAYALQVQTETARIDAISKRHASEMQYITAKAGVDTESEKVKMGYWGAELSARTQWQGHVASVYAQLGSSFASAANVSMSMGVSNSYGHSMSYGQSVSRSYGIGVSVSADDPGGLDLTPTLSGAPNYISWSSC